MRHVLMLALVLALFGGALGEEACVVEYYYENFCETCQPEAQFAMDFKALTGVSLSDCRFAGYNAVTEEGRRALEEAMAERGLDEVSLPMVIANGEVYQGEGEFRSALVMDALEWGSPAESTLVYLYSPGCESCREVEALLESLPETVEVPRGDVTFQSRVVVHRVDATAQPEVARALFEERGVAEDDRVTPAIFLPNRELLGSEEISRSLMDLLARGKAVGEVRLATGEEGGASAGRVAGLAVAGLAVLALAVWTARRRRKAA